MNKTFDGPYLEIKRTSVSEKVLHVTFGNGESIELPTAKLTLPRVPTAIHWTQARVNEFGTAIVVPAKPDDVEIPADLLRRLTDRQFADHVVGLATEQARLIGSRLKQLRQARGLTQAAVARLAQIEPANLSRIENGKFDVASRTLWRILAAIGCSVADLASTQSSQSAPSGRPAAAAARG